MDRQRYYLWLYNIILFFIVFDGMRNNIIGNEILSPIKEIAIFILFIVNIRKWKDVFILLIKPLRLLWLYILFVGVLGLFDSEALSITNTTINIFKFSMFFMLTINLMNFEFLTSETFDYVYKKIVVFSLFYCCLNILSVFVSLPIWKEQEQWFGRFGMGYPTTDTISLCLALIILLFKSNLFHYEKFKKVIFEVIITIGIAMQVTGSALILLPVIWLVYFVHSGLINTSKLITISILICGIVIVSPAIDKKLHTELGERYENAYMLVDVKINNFIKGEETDNFDSKQARKNQYNYAQKVFIDNTFKELFGCGIQNFTMNQSLMSNKSFHIENMFLLFVVAFGYFGTFLLLICFIYFIIKALSGIYQIEDKLFLLTLCGVVLVANSALVSFYLIQIYGTMSILAVSYNKLQYNNDYEYNTYI